MITIKNEKITIEIAEHGAEIKRILHLGEDRLFDGNPKYWGKTAPILFPVCGRLKDGIYTLNGKTYNMTPHGFARDKFFTVESKGDTKATFLLKSDEQTLEIYPFEFEFRVTYSLNDTTLTVEYEAKNLSNEIMYAAIGCHEAYSCPEGIEAYDIIFEKEETLNTHLIEGPLVSRETKTILEKGDTLPLKYEYFEIDALIFTDIKSRFVTLKNRLNGKTVSVSFPDRDYLLIWTKPGAPFICIEPWTCCPGFVDDVPEIAKKPGIKKIEPNTVFKTAHTISF